MADEVVIIDKPLICLVCGNNKFRKVDVKLNSKGAAIFDVEIFAKGGVAFICDKCGFAHQFFE